MSAWDGLLPKDNQRILIQAIFLVDTLDKDVNSFSMRVRASCRLSKSGCEGRGELPCRTCNAGQAPGHYKENLMNECNVCYRRGLVAHRDGYDTICKKCNGKGKLPCVTCGSRGRMKCETCEGRGSHLTRNAATVRWKTLSTGKVSATSGATSVPDEVFHRAKGIQLCNIQAYQCTPAFFEDSYFLNKFSSDVIAERSHVPPAARIIQSLE